MVAAQRVDLGTSLAVAAEESGAERIVDLVDVKITPTAETLSARVEATDAEVDFLQEDDHLTRATVERILRPFALVPRSTPPADQRRELNINHAHRRRLRPL